MRSRLFATATTLAPILCLPIALSGLLHACGPVFPRGESLVDISNPEEAWDANNDPRRLRDRYVVQYNALPRSGTIRSETPWTDTYWPSYMGGLAQRWNDANGRRGFDYQPPSEAAVRSMNQSQLAKLSPAEKYDIYNGRFDYPFVASERQRTSPDLPSWHGLCHGWAPAALLYSEPNAVSLVGTNGITVPFGSSDVKALLIYVQQARDTRTGSRMLGGRCDIDLSNNPGSARDPQCRDVNAGSFHILLTNTVGLEGTALVADIQRDLQVWNHPLISFSTQMVGETSNIPASAARGTVRILTMNTTVRYVSGLGPSWNPVPASRYPQQISSRVYQYNIELDAGGNIIGGEWATSDRPDFLWTQGAPRFVGYYAAVNDIYRASIGR